MAQTGSLDKLASFAINLANAPRTGDGFARALGNAVVEEVVVDSNFNPPVSFAPFAPGDPNAPGAPKDPQTGGLGPFVRPRIRLKMGLGEDVIIAPWGQPTGSPYPNIIGLGSAVVSLTALLLGNKKTAGTFALISAGAFGWGYFQNKAAQ